MIVRRNDRVVVLGITGQQGTFWTERMIAYGTNVVAGVNPKRAGETHVGVPIFATACRSGRENRRRCRRDVHSAADGEGGGDDAPRRRASSCWSC